MSGPMRSPELPLSRVGAGIWARPGWESEALAWRTAVGAEPPPAEAGSAGRGGARPVALRDGGRGWLKTYRHGGLLRGLLGDVYWERPERPLREAAATEAARRAGAAAPEVLAAIAVPLPSPLGRLYRAALVTRELAGRRSLADALRSSQDAAARSVLIGRCWDVLRRLHASGIHHRDANATNFLVGCPDDEPALIDFDGAVVFDGPVGEAGRWMARRRLVRSVAKLGLPGLDRAGVAAILDARGPR